MAITNELKNKLRYGGKDFDLGTNSMCDCFLALISETKFLGLILK